MSGRPIECWHVFARKERSVGSKKSGNRRRDLDDSFELLDSVMGCRPANQAKGALNSATAAAGTAT